MLFKIILITLFFFTIVLLVSNFRIKIRKVNYKLKSKNKKEDKETKKYKVLHISDFHNRNFGWDNKYLINKIKKINLDLVFITGDMFDRRKTNTVIVESFFDQLNKILELNNQVEELGNNRVFYVYGNHEKYKEGEFLNQYEEMLVSKNIKLLKNELVQLELNNEIINIIGLDDITARRESLEMENPETKISLMDLITKGNDRNRFNMKKVKQNVDSFFEENKKTISEGHNLVLIHRPEPFDIYQDYDMDLVFAGHAHGGQVRLPFTDLSLIGPNQGFLPKYTKGPYTKNNTTMYVSLGLGNSLLPIRVFAGPELIELDLEI